MRFVTFEHVTKGMVLGRPVYSDNGSILIKDGCVISDSAFRHIESLGLQGLYIMEEGFDDVVIEDVVPEKLRTMAYDALAKGDYTLCVSLAKSMVSEIRSTRNPSFDLLDLKSFKNYEYHHCVSVAIYSIGLGIKLGLNEEQLNNLAVAGILHDIGKFDVKKRVLNSKQVYNDKQMDEMMKHPMYSYEEVKENPSVSSVSRNSILFHHENIDGSGYYGIAGEKLGLMPRILRVIDTYDALTATRRHRAAFSPDFAFRSLIKDAGKIYDVDVVRTFVNSFPMYPIGFTYSLSNGEEGVVIAQTEDVERPKMRLLTGGTINLAKDSDYKTVEIKEMV